MLTAKRRHHHWRVNQRYSERIKWNPSWRTWRLAKDQRELIYDKYGVGWSNHRGMGKWYKRRLSRAERRYAKAQCRGFRGSEPTGLRGEVSWRGT